MKDLTGTAGSGSTGSTGDDADSEATQVIDTQAVDTQVINTQVINAEVTRDGDVGPHESANPAQPEGRSRGLVAAIIAGSVLLVLVVAVYLVDLLSTSGEIERHTTIAGVEVGGMTPEQAAAALTAQAAPAYIAPVTVDVHGVATPIDPAAAGLRFSVDEYRPGRRNPLGEPARQADLVLQLHRPCRCRCRSTTQR